LQGSENGRVVTIEIENTHVQFYKKSNFSGSKGYLIGSLTPKINIHLHCVQTDPAKNVWTRAYLIPERNQTKKVRILFIYLFFALGEKHKVTILVIFIHQSFRQYISFHPMRAIQRENHPYHCYYCKTTFVLFEEVIKHSTENHSSLMLKAKYLELNPSSGHYGYKSLNFNVISLTPTPNFAQFLFELLTLNGTICIEGTIDE
jgi:hypothetical protein